MTIYQLMEDLTEEEYRALKNDIAIRGIIIPIELDEGGNVLDGHHRLKAWEELKAEGVEVVDYPRVVRAGWSEEQKRNHIRALNLLRRQLSKKQKEKIWADMRKDHMSYRMIAKATGVSKSDVHRSIASDKVSESIDSGVPNGTPEYVIGKDRKRYPSKKNPPEAPSVSIFTGTDKGEEKAKVKAQKIVDTGSEGASQEVQATIFSSESKEYYTPVEYLEAARNVMGSIDLDPASCVAAQADVKAEQFYTEIDDGLTRDWHGHVWLNPPYGKTANRSNQDIWAKKLEEEYGKGNVSEAILLVKSATGYNWFEELLDNWPVCFARKRISFTKKDGTNEGQSKQGTAFFYFGVNVEKFIEVFCQFGHVVWIKEGKCWRQTE